MNIKLTPEQQRLIEREVESGHFRTAEEVIAEALLALQEKGSAQTAEGANGDHREAVQAMLAFAERNRTRLDGVSVKELIHEGRRL
jgi:Arc/MetJ-type ribon-helix-helix transcriptional regulator